MLTNKEKTSELQVMRNIFFSSFTFFFAAKLERSRHQYHRQVLDIYTKIHFHENLLFGGPLLQPLGLRSPLSNLHCAHAANSPSARSLVLIWRNASDAAWQSESSTLSPPPSSRLLVHHHHVRCRQNICSQSSGTRPVASILMCMH